MKRIARETSKSNIPSFLTLVVALSASGFATFYIYDFASDSIDDLTLRLMGDVSKTIQLEIRNFVDQAVIPMTIVKQAAEEEFFNVSYSQINDVPKALEYLFHAIKANPLLTGVFYIDVYGTDIGYGRNEDVITAFFMFRNITKQAGLYAIDKKGRFNWTLDTPLVEVEGLTDVTYWPPFYTARQTKQTVWSDTYSLNGINDIIYARVEPLFWKSNGELFAALGLNIGVRVWSSFLSGIRITDNSKMYIMDSRGILLADDNAKFSGTTGVSVDALPTGMNSTDIIIAASAQHLQSKYSKISGIPYGNKLHAFVFDDQKQITLTSRMDIAPTFKLIIVIVIPQGDVIGSISSIRIIAIGLTLMALFFGTIRYMPLSWAYKTYKQLNEKQIQGEQSESFENEHET